MNSPAIAIPSPPPRSPAPVVTPEDDDGFQYRPAQRPSRSRRPSELWSRSWSAIFSKNISYYNNIDDDGNDGETDTHDHVDAVDHANASNPMCRGQSGTSLESDHTNRQDSTNEQTPLICRKQPRRSSLIHGAFNGLNLLAGMSILTLPYTFKLTGWVLGITLLIVFALTASHTAKLLTKCMDHPDCTGPGGLKAISYGDVGEAAYGLNGRRFISVIFSVQMLAACVAYTILIGDSIQALFPHFNPFHIKVFTWAILTPTTWPKSMRLLSYTSLVGIITLVNMVVIILYNGFTTSTSPGSIWKPAPTHVLPPKIDILPIAIGLTMVGLDGHSVFPSIYRDLQGPRRFKWVVAIAYTLAVLLYLIVAAAGYCMFGDETLQEITQNLPTVPTFNTKLTQYTILLVAINPATKFALLIEPVNVNIEQHLYWFLLWLWSLPSSIQLLQA
ncbi:hypothetical protein SeMB42_g01682 [Synchytrium endobioticum]|uniref:Amino acid transporter transmembrane domain-containing protein n=1 Tax=Synchytrium endobioticum TaxID=286115 RepID=A0A507DK91_9FUNG|nr:hypothetical protein SeMB42_g01682 [Synchytrium endobioticum]